MSENNFVTPDVTELTMPAESFQKAAQSVVGAPKETLTKRSFFDDDLSGYAARLAIDGETFYFDPLGEDQLKWVQQAPRRLAALCGVSLEEYRSGMHRQTPEEVSNGEVPRPIVPTPEQEELNISEGLKMIDYVLAAALRSWSLPQECTPDRKRHLHPDLKRELFERIIGFATNGESEAQFRERRRITALNR